MKKAKIVLSAVALFAVVGGALAFKATRTPITLYTGTTNTIQNPNHACTQTTAGVLGEGTLVYASTRPLAAGCPVTLTTAFEQ